MSRRGSTPRWPELAARGDSVVKGYSVGQWVVFLFNVRDTPLREKSFILGTYTRSFWSLFLIMMTNGAFHFGGELGIRASHNFRSSSFLVHTTKDFCDSPHVL